MDLRILVVTNTFPSLLNPGDSPQIKDQIEAIKSRGVKIDLLHIDRHKSKSNYFWAALKIIGLSVQRKKFDLLHAYYGHCGLLSLLQVRYPVIVTFLGSDLLHPRDARIGKIAAKYADGVIVQSEEMKMVTKRDDAVIAPFGVNQNLFSVRKKEEVRKELGLGLGEKLVLFPWDPERKVKRFDVIKEAIQIVKKNFENVRIVTVFNQPHELVAKYMQACDVMILASDHEGSPMALREAMACNLPIVAVNVGDVCQMIGNTEGCFLCKREPPDIAEKVCKVFERSTRTNGAFIMRRASINWGAAQVLTLYNQVLNFRSKKKKTE